MVSWIAWVVTLIKADGPLLDCMTDRNERRNFKVCTGHHWIIGLLRGGFQGEGVPKSSLMFSKVPQSSLGILRVPQLPPPPPPWTPPLRNPTIETKVPQAKDIVLGVNGEIYNYTDLQDSLEARWADIVCGVSLICAKAWRKFKFGGLELIQNLGHFDI